MSTNDISQRISAALAGVPGLHVSQPSEAVQALPWATVYLAEVRAEIVSGSLTRVFRVFEVVALVSRSLIPAGVWQMHDLIDAINGALLGWVTAEGVEIVGNIECHTRPVEWGGTVFYGAVFRITIKTSGGV